MMTHSRSNAELTLLRRMASASHDTRLEGFVKSLDSARVEAKLSDRSLLRFWRIGADPVDKLQLEKISGDWMLLDSDGTRLDLLLFLDSGGNILEMEFIRYEGGDLIEPVWDSLQGAGPPGSLPLARVSNRRPS